MKTIFLSLASLLVATNLVFARDEPDLDDPKVREEILKQAVFQESLEMRGFGDIYKVGEKQTYTGWAKKLHPNGKLAQLHSFKNGKTHGRWIFWHENGQKQFESTSKAGRMEGLVVNWYESGKKSAETNYKNGKKEGLMTWWHENGRKSAEINYKDGKLDGPWTEWDKDGVKVREGTYEMASDRELTVSPPAGLLPRPRVYPAQE